MKAFVNLLKEQETNTGRKIFSAMEMKDIARKEKLMFDDFNALISKLNENGLLLKRGPSSYMVTSSN